MWSCFLVVYILWNLSDKDWSYVNCWYWLIFIEGWFEKLVSVENVVVVCDKVVCMIFCVFVMFVNNECLNKFLWRSFCNFVRIKEKLRL